MGLGATILSCAEAQWPTALQLLMASWPPSSHALGALLTATRELPEVQERLLRLLPVVTVDGVGVPGHLRALLGKSYTARGESDLGLYRHSKELRLLQQVLKAQGLEQVLSVMESYTMGSRRWLKLAGSQKAEVLEAVLRAAPSGYLDVLEIGSYCGYSALRMHRLLRKGCIHSLEADPVIAWVARNVLKAAGASAKWRISMNLSGHSDMLNGQGP